MNYYLMWYDDDRKKPVIHKIEEGVAAYKQRFQQQPNVVLLSENEQVEGTLDVQLRPVAFIRPSNFYIGHEDAA